MPATPHHTHPKKTYRLLAVDADTSSLSLYRDILCLEAEQNELLSALAPLSHDAAAPRQQPHSTGPRYELTECTDGSCALEHLRGEAPIAIALVDAHLAAAPADPQAQDSQSLAAAMRSLAPALEIVLTVGQSDAPDHAALNALLRDAGPPEKMLFLHKPFRPRELRQLARSLTAKWHTDVELRKANDMLWDTVYERTRELEVANERLRADIAERQQVLERLQKSEERYRLLFEEDITGNFVAAPDGTLTDCNATFARMFGYKRPADAIGQVNVLELELPSQPASKSDDTSTVPVIERLLPTEGDDRTTSATFEALIHPPARQGSAEGLAGEHAPPPMHVICRFDSVLNSSGRISEFRGFFFDISESRYLEEKLRRAQKMEALGTLAGGIAHDFNNILGVILGYAEMMAEDEAPASPRARRVEAIIGAGRRARDLVRQILDFSRQGSHEKRPMAMTPLVKETVKMLRASIPAHIHIEESYTAADDAVQANPAQIHQIILNLVSNAAQAIGERSGRIRVELSRTIIARGQPGRRGAGRSGSPLGNEQSTLPPGPYLRLQVTDDGPGMDQSTQDRIFDPFFTTKRPGEGTGMGLSVVHGIVSGHGGAVHVQSEPGMGAEFGVLLPATTFADTEELFADMVHTPESARILLVDDEPELAEVTAEMLTTLGHRAEYRTSPVEALELFRHRAADFDMVITDQAMPSMTGIELVRELRALAPRIPVILVTGFSETVTPERARELGISRFLLKPVLKRQLAEAVHGALGRSDS